MNTKWVAKLPAELYKIPFWSDICFYYAYQVIVIRFVERGFGTYNLTSECKICDKHVLCCSHFGVKPLFFFCHLNVIAIGCLVTKERQKASCPWHTKTDSSLMSCSSVLSKLSALPVCGTFGRSRVPAVKPSCKPESRMGRCHSLTSVLQTAVACPVRVPWCIDVLIPTFLCLKK